MINPMLDIERYTACEVFISCSYPMRAGRKLSILWFSSHGANLKEFGLVRPRYAALEKGKLNWEEEIFACSKMARHMLKKIGCWFTDQQVLVLPEKCCLPRIGKHGHFRNKAMMCTLQNIEFGGRKFWKARSSNVSFLQHWSRRAGLSFIEG